MVDLPQQLFSVACRHPGMSKTKSTYKYLLKIVDIVVEIEY